MAKAFVLGAVTLAGFVVMASAQEESPKPVDLAAEYQSLINAERAFAKKSVDTNAKEAFLAFIADDGVLFDPDPIPGKAAWEKRPVPDYTLEAGGGSAKAGDLGYVYGSYERKGEKPESGSYVRVWKREPGETWKLALAVLSPRPAG